MLGGRSVFVLYTPPKGACSIDVPLVTHLYIGDDVDDHTPLAHRGRYIKESEVLRYYYDGDLRQSKMKIP